MVANGIFFV